MDILAIDGREETFVQQTENVVGESIAVMFKTFEFESELAGARRIFNGLSQGLDRKSTRLNSSH